MIFRVPYIEGRKDMLLFHNSQQEFKFVMPSVFGCQRLIK